MPHVQGQATGSAGLDPQMQTKHCEKNFLEKKPGELTHYGGGSLQKLLVKANFFFFFFYNCGRSLAFLSITQQRGAVKFPPPVPSFDFFYSLH